MYLKKHSCILISYTYVINDYKHLKTLHMLPYEIHTTVESVCGSQANPRYNDAATSMYDAGLSRRSRSHSESESESELANASAGCFCTPRRCRHALPAIPIQSTVGFPNSNIDNTCEPRRSVRVTSISCAFSFSIHASECCGSVCLCVRVFCMCVCICASEGYYGGTTLYVR